MSGESQSVIAELPTTGDSRVEYGLHVNDNIMEILGHFNLESVIDQHRKIAIKGVW